MNCQLTAVDLFSGCGGLSYGLSSAGFHFLAGVDIDSVSLTTFKRNHPEARSIEADLAKLKPNELLNMLGLKKGALDLLVGGPPCQGFSKNVPRRERYLDDPRNLLMFRFLEFVEAFLPRAVIIENVAEMKRAFNSTFTGEILKVLEELGYGTEARILSAADYGVPQVRRRVFTIAVKGKNPPPFPTPTHRDLNNYNTDRDLFGVQSYITVRDAIGDLPPLCHGEGRSPQEYTNPPQSDYQRWARRGSNMLYDHVARKLRPKQYQRLASIKAGQGAADLPEELRPRSHYSGAYGRLKWDSIAPTITRWVFHPGSGRFGHPRDIRVITIREAARLQGFPDSFVFEGSYTQKSHQVGNAVPPLLAKKLGRALLPVLKEGDGA